MFIEAIQDALLTAAETGAATAWGVTPTVTFADKAPDRFEALGTGDFARIDGTVTIALEFDNEPVDSISVGEVSIKFTNAAS